MKDKSKTPDKLLTFIILALLAVGFFIFMSASFGLLTRDGAPWSRVLFSQLVLGLGGGLVAGIVAYYVPLNWLRRYSLYLFMLAVILSLLVFVPGIGFGAGGAWRWISIMGISFQPSELLKLALIIVLASWYANAKNDVSSIKYGLAPLLIGVGIAGVILMNQPDTGTFMVMFFSSLAIFVVAGGRFKHLAFLAIGGLLLISVLALTRPYIRARITTFIDPSADPLGSSYQLHQSLLAIGSGRLTGRGFGQSVQKYQYLPEAMGDSVFAVLGEEFGLMGTLFILILFISFCTRGLVIAKSAITSFNRLLATGLVIMITSQAMMHIAAMIGLMPLTGITLPFISHGGTSLLISIMSMGILLQISKNQGQKIK